ncbi:cytochrome P450 [Wolfiporia cocos MD-104 SS10]|uniref:Cytochrome P450 n=1 Tax=Wolfiporia cocos (strain MD-104) TaxID=742152 RepID=A0A2H3J7N0_WOLCO|nr:cytochrome P450 [Wolfiporia cocos MD-104 SS10]
MSITLNRLPSLPTSFYPEDALGRPSGNLAGFITGVRRVALESSPTLIACVLVNLVVLCYVFTFLSTKNVIPTVGYPHWLGSYSGVLRFLIDSKSMVDEGYRKYKGGFFRIPLVTNWTYIIANPKCIDEMYHLPEEVLSLRFAAADELQLPYTMGQQLHDNPYHLPILRSKLTRHIDFLVGECLDEMTKAMDETLGKELNSFDTFTTIIARTFNRILVGAPTCRSKDYTDVCKAFAVNTGVVGFIINLFPSILRPVVGRLITQLPSLTRRTLFHLEPVIKERRAAMAEYGSNWPEKPMDMLMWLMEAAEGIEKEPERLAVRILVLNIATIHSTATSVIQGLNCLMENIEYADPLREEAESALRTHGWTKHAINQLVKTDSFLKEASRLNAIGITSFPRKALRDITFSDGTTVPKGAYISSPFAIHYDEEFYPDPLKFDGFRHVQDTGNRANNSSGMIRTNAHYLIFGHGKYPWEAQSLTPVPQPGRFIATYMMKATMAYLLTHYDVKFGAQGRLPNIVFQYNHSPNMRAT